MGPQSSKSILKLITSLLLLQNSKYTPSERPFVLTLACPHIHNWSLPPFSQYYNLPFHTTYIVCVNFIYERLNLPLKSTPNDRFLKNFSWQFPFTFRVFAKNPLRGSCRRNIFIFSFWCLIQGLNSGLTSNQPTNYLLDYYD